MKYIRDFDKSVVGYVGKLPHWVQPVMTAATYIGSPVTVALILLFVMGATYLQKNMRLLAGEAAVLVLLPVAAVIKLLVHRSRPATIYAQHMRFKSYSFPSGHAYGSFIVFGLLIYICFHYLPDPWRWIVSFLLALLILLVGISRVYLGAHFPSDVLAGWLLGALVLSIVLKFIVKP
ncbi:MAG: hypothetical protein NVS1B7_0770 [Candidatus Saccharimonadales bacterium]